MMIMLVMTLLTFIAFREVFKFSIVNTTNKTLMFAKSFKTEGAEKILKVASKLNFVI